MKNFQEKEIKDLTKIQGGHDWELDFRIAFTMKFDGNKATKVFDKKDQKVVNVEVTYTKEVESSVGQ